MSTTPKNLNLEDLNKLAPIAQERLRAAIDEQTQTVLDLSHMDLGDKGIIIITALLVLTKITTLDVSYNNIGDAGAASLAGNQTLTTLNVSINNIEDDGVASLAGNQILTMLDINSNNFGDVGAASLANNQTLTTLDVSYNNIGDVGAASLANNQTLTTLNVRDNDIGDAGELQIAGMVVRNKQNLTNFKNEVSAIHKGMIDEKSLFSTLPIELSVEIANVLAKTHGLFAPSLRLEINRCLGCLGSHLKNDSKTS